MRTKTTENLFNVIVTENFPDPENSQAKYPFRAPHRNIQRKAYVQHSRVIRKLNLILPKHFTNRNRNSKVYNNKYSN